jgi:GNAT superfamily N-acetyltransferase
MQIRPATIEDLATIVEFNRLLALETESIELSIAVLTDGVRAALLDPHKARYFVAEADGQIFGQLMHTREWSDWRNGDIWWLQSVYVVASARRQGVFRALVEHVTQLAQSTPDVVGLRSRRGFPRCGAAGCTWPGGRCGLEPVLIWPVERATARSAIVVSSVSPLRWLDDARVAVAMRELDRLDRFGQRADLVDLDQDAVGDSLVDAALQALGVGDEQVVADQLHLGAEPRR